MIIIAKNYLKTELVEMAERKGLGHPDTLCDLIAEDFSNSYSKYCLEHFGCILNHWADKMLLSGGTAELNYGDAIITKPMTAYLFGKAVLKIGERNIDIEGIFKESVSNIFSKIFGQEILNHIKYFIDTNNGIGKEHSIEFYSPKSVDEIKNSWETLRANDTVICSGYAPLSFTEKLCIDLENFINSADFKKHFPETGWDVKVMITRIKNKFDITICLPFIASKTPSHKYYCEKLEKIRKEIQSEIDLKLSKSIFRSAKFSLNINTKDKGEFVYLTAFGTALDKGDYGAVGRGNKYCGIIAINRESNIEAVSGKNPINHAGKLYTVLAHEIASEIYKLTSQGVCVNISARNGDDISSPAFVVIKYSGILNKDKRRALKEIAENKLKKVGYLSLELINADVIENHISKAEFLA